MEYEIKGDNLPVVICKLDPGGSNDFSGRSHGMDVR